MMHARSLTAAIMLAALTPQAHAQFALDWTTIEPGTLLSAPGFELRVVLGQPDAGAQLSAPGFSLSGGFLVGGPGCVADTDDGSGTGTPDGGVGIEDLLYYLTAFEAGTLDADVDDGTGTGTPDGGVGIEDLLYFLARFEAGC